MAKTTNRPQQERDRYQEITDKLIGIMETGRRPWEKPWNSEAASGFQRPVNAVTGKRYSGINQIILMSNDASFETGDPRWCTFKQAESKGWKVRKGSKSESVIFYRQVSIRGAATDDEDARTIPVMKSFPVFHASQLDGIPEYKISDNLKAWNTVDAADIIMTNSGARITTGPDAAYIPAIDTIRMPPKETFKTVEGYAATALHELGHWTSDKSRLDREIFFHKDNREEYAKEELRAELASTFICAEIGISCELEQHASYLAGWLKALKEDKKEIFRAARDAQKIADFCLNFHPEYAKENAPAPTEAEVQTEVAPEAEDDIGYRMAI